ncbi:unnamed protein product [Owenia fusiformis]|uniref:V-type proton ATPase subunit a n=1 Tax=Owenia fusiformis TaxID=6347 RepID=A0A8J1UQS7_OWEFU|nr:unnamed protein product [Owenia fusiformis]
MGELFRSEEMSLCQLYLQTEAAYACVSELGELGLVQFKDLNPEVNAFQRKFVAEVRRCDEMERQLRFFEGEIKKEEIKYELSYPNPEAPFPRDMVDLEATFDKLENELKEIHSNAETIHKNYNELTELKYVLRKTADFFEEEHGLDEVSDMLTHPTSDRRHLVSPVASRYETETHLGFVAGVVLRERMAAFERLLWFACRGNVYIKTAEIEELIDDLGTGEPVQKSVFVVFFQGEHLKTKVMKICEGFRATLYPCPESLAERKEMGVGVMQRLEDMKTVLNQSKEMRVRVLTSISQNLESWFVKAQKIKAIYHTMNMFRTDNKTYIAECFCPTKDLDLVQVALRRGGEKSGSTVPSIVNTIPATSYPTYFRTNRFTLAFQAIVDAYGIASYREVNPTPYTIITFPFLFAIMFGDSGHGLIMFAFGLWMVVYERKLSKGRSDNEIWTTIFGGRYVVFLMGLFSIYTGFIYNDCFSKSLNIFGSSWRANAYDESTIEHNKVLQLDPGDPNAWIGRPYPFGMDPVWTLTKNKITFLNSFKMKLSVILGVLQMTFGVILGVFNHRHFRRPLNIISEFLPMIIFLMAIFGYLCAVIVVKWVKYNVATGHCAPSLLIGLINMFLFKDPVVGKDPCNTYFWYPGQHSFQLFLVATAGICVPWLLLSKPLYLLWRHKRETQAMIHQPMVNESDEQVANGKPTTSSDAGGHGHGEKFEFGEIFIHQVIHTIEYCLGCISNTASYLRLWALSLAHGQLSEVLWNMVLKIGLGMNGWAGAPLVFVVFVPWAVLTIAVLLIMEGLSAFLHALRLHWVEFQNKFYEGTGEPFEPFLFQNIAENTAIQ